MSFEEIGNMTTAILSERECKEIISKAANIHSDETDIRYQLNAVEDSFGYIADLARLTIWIRKATDEGSEEKFIYFVKLIPLDSNGEILRSDLTWMFEREAFMYSEILMKFNGTIPWKPKCYIARKDLLVLEDLNLSGFKHLAHRTRFDRPLVECVLRSLAAIHAESIDFETRIYPKNMYDVFGGYREEFAITPDNMWFQRGLEAIKMLIPLTPSYHKYSRKYSNERFDELVSPIYEMVKPSSKYRNFFCHQDLWAGNIMFKYDENAGEETLSEPVSCVIMDYQFARYLPPVADVLMFILMTTRLDNRRNHLSHYYQYYYDCLRAELDKHKLIADDILTWNDFHASCEDLKLFPIVFNFFGLPFTFYPNDIQIKIKSSSAEEFRRVREENHHDYIIHHMKQDDVFKHVVLESIEELMETMFE